MGSSEKFAAMLTGVGEVHCAAEADDAVGERREHANPEPGLLGGA